MLNSGGAFAEPMICSPFINEAGQLRQAPAVDWMQKKVSNYVFCALVTAGSKTEKLKLIDNWPRVVECESESFFATAQNWLDEAGFQLVVSDKTNGFQSSCHFKD